MKEAQFYESIEDGKVICHLCPQQCTIAEGRLGTCKVRRNNQGKLITENYGLLSSVRFDPIEKKPLYHYYPGKEILSVGTVGCNMKCNFCQNCEISQVGVNESDFLKEYTEGRLVSMAKSRSTNIGIAYTYNEPTVFYEFIMDTAIAMKEEGLKNILVSNGYIQPEPLNKLMDVVDACNIDLKGFTEEFYNNHTFATLQPVLDTLKYIRSRGKHLEVTHLLIPSLNDDESIYREMIQWISDELGSDTVFHISRYFPRYMANEPSTPDELLEQFFTIASEKLSFVYLGNAYLGVGHNTYCPKCNSKVTDRRGYDTTLYNLDKGGKCTECGHQIYTYL